MSSPVRNRHGRAPRWVLLLALAVTALPAVSATTPPRVEEAHLRLVIDTAADWADIRFTPGRLVAVHTVSAPTGVDVSHRSDGLSVRSWRPTARAVVDVVFAETTGASSVDLEIRRSGRGSAAVEVTNLNGVGVHVVHAVDDRWLPAPEEPRRWSLPTARLLGAEPLALPHADGRRLTLAFYYPWWRTYDDPRLADRPAEPRSSHDAADVRSVTDQATAAGLDGFVVSWAGDGHDGAAFDLALGAAEGAGSVVTGYLEVPAAVQAAGGDVDRTTGIVREWLHELLRRRSSPAFLRAHGDPVVFVFGMAELPPSRWRTILSELRLRGTPVRLVGDAPEAAFARLGWGEHSYDPVGSPEERLTWERERALRTRALAAIDPGTHPQLHVATVSPGFDDHRIRDGNPVVDRADGARYDDTWRSALAADPDWVVVTSWNEWFEGTAIEPSVLHGDRALEQTRAWVDAWG